MEVLIKIMIGGLLLTEGIRDFLQRKIAVLSTVVIAAAGVVLHFFEKDFFLPDVVGGVVIGVCILALAKVTAEGIGYGDGWMFLAVGIVFGLKKTFIMLCITLAICVGISVALLIFCKAGKKTELPFVMFMFPAYVLVCVMC